MSKPREPLGEAGFSLVETMVASLVLTVGLVGMAQLLAVSTIMHSDARQATTVTLLAQSKLDELMRLNLTAAAVAPGGSLDADVADHFDAPQAGITRRWLVVDNTPIAGTRLLTVRVQNMGGRVYGRQQDVTTVIRQW